MSTVDMRDKDKQEERKRLKIIQKKPKEDEGLKKLTVTVSNNNQEETNRTVSRKTAERVDKPNTIRGDKVADDTEQDIKESDDGIERNLKILKKSQEEI